MSANPPAVRSLPSSKPGMGALPSPDGTTFRVWAPFASAVAVEHRVASLVGALKYADANFEALCGLTESARVAQMARYEAQRHKLVERLRALVS